MDSLPCPLSTTYYIHLPDAVLMVVSGTMCLILHLSLLPAPYSPPDKAPKDPLSWYSQPVSFPPTPISVGWT